MALPTLVKTYDHSINHVGGTAVTNLIDHKNNLLVIKNALIDVGLTKPMTVSSSSNASVADTSDNWSTIGDLVWADGVNPHSWIVWKSQCTTGDQYEICFSCNWSTQGYRIGGVFFSPSGSFPTNGTTTQRPIAPDEQTLNADTGYWMCGYATTFASKVHVIMSQDGDVMTMMSWINDECKALWRFDHIADAVTGAGALHVWTPFPNGAIHLLRDASWGPWIAAYQRIPIIGGGACATQFSYEMLKQTGYDPFWEYQNFANEWDGSYPMCPVGIWGNSIGYRGRVGTATDLWWGLTSAGEGDMYPDTPTLYQFAQGGAMIFPWDSTTVMQTA